MATYFVSSSGSNDSTPPAYNTWAKAATSLATALAAATTNGDIIVIQRDAVPTADSAIGADTTYTISADISVISATNDGGSSYTPSEMGASYWIGGSSASWAITVTGAYNVLLFGLTFRNTGGAKSISIAFGDGAAYILDQCYLWLGTTSTSANLFVGGVGNSNNSYVSLINCTLRFGATAQGIRFSCSGEMIGGSVSGSGSAPSIFTKWASDMSSSYFRFIGADLSAITDTLVGGSTSSTVKYEFAQCKFASGVALITASPSPANASYGEVLAFDCASGDEHYHIRYANALGDLTVSTTCYVTSDGAAYNNAASKCSWKIVTTGNAAFLEPFVTPWISVHHEGTSAITPYLEGVCDNFTPKESEVWSEWTVKSNSGSPLATFNNSDRGGVTASATNQSSSSLTASDWTGEPATPVFIKLAPTASVTPAEIGDLCARVSVAIPGKTLYIDPQIRGRS